MISIVAAMTEPGLGIGLDGKLPWHIPEDLMHFKRLTHGHVVVMGRKTYESIGMPLPGRENRVVTRRTDLSRENVRVFDSVLAACTADAEGREIFVIGGGEVYRQALDLVDRMYLTFVGKNFECDTYFSPEYFPRFTEVERRVSPPGTARDYPLAFTVWQRGCVP